MPLRTRSQTRSPQPSSGSSNDEEPLPPSSDKENIETRDIFQPPSPTKRGKSPKTLSTKKILKPNPISSSSTNRSTSSQWHQSSSATSSSLAKRQPRTSPIHHETQQAEAALRQSPSYLHQDRDHRESGRSRHTKDMQGFSIAQDLDFAKSDDEYGPPIVDCFNLPLGSFAEDDSPPREPKRRSPRSSPTHYNFYRQSPPSTFGPPVPPPGYYVPSPGYYQPPGYYPPAPPEPWASPPAYDFARRREDRFRQDDYHRREERPREPRAAPEDSPPSKKARRWTERSTTPEKPKQKEESHVRSPFRSPIPSDRGSKNFRRSPVWGVGTPSIGIAGSFGIDTPGATLDEFSPMGPSFAGLGDEYTPGLPLEGENLDQKLILARSSSGEDRVRPLIRQRRDPNASPFASFMEELSPPPRQIQGSPVQKGPDRYFHERERDHVRERPQLHPLPSSRRRDLPPSSSKRHLYTSPVTTSQSKQRPPSWYESSGQGRPVRLELEDMGLKTSETRKGLEGINSMVRGETGTPSGHPHPLPPPPPPSHSGSYDGGPFRSSMTTPIKSTISSQSSSSMRRMPYSESRTTNYQKAARKAPPPAAPQSMPRYPSLPTNSTSRSGTSSGKSTPSGKENVTPRGQRRNPCNCKRSKCLKLYCECFAAELYCDGCNCNDCRNTPEYDEMRSKAMKDTRAKNPMAFKPRFSVRKTGGPAGVSPASAHNMGCKCKRSECLKKYCECFQAGVMCGSKCKCVDCLNFVGSQALIDKRRKIKDHRGADFAMRIADEAWKGKHSSHSSSTSRGMPPMASPSQGHPHHPGYHLPPMPPHMMHPSPQGHHHPRAPPPHYMAPPHMMGPPPIGYSPMPPMTPMYVQSNPPTSRSKRPAEEMYDSKAAKRQSSQTQVTPRTPAVRLGYDASSSKKRRKLGPGDKEETFPYFGELPEQPKTTALGIFSFLSNDDLYNAGLVCKRWSRLAIDEELWQF